jgi:hypothetical protein
MNKFNLNEGNEALNRALLMMKYDAKKTLTENVDEIEEQTTGKSSLAVGSSALGAGVGAAAAVYGATAGSAVFPVVGTIIGAGLGFGVGYLIDWATNGHKEKDDFANLVKFCSTSKAKQIMRGVDDSEVTRVTRQIEDAKGFWNDDEDAIVTALSSLKSISDLCAVNQRIKGGLVEFLDTVTNSPDEWRMFTRPLEDLVKYSKIKFTPEQIDKVKQSGGFKKGGVAPVTKSKYHKCVGTYTQGCISDAITQIQGCLSLVTDGKFGPKTQAALASKGFTNGFKDSDVPKICKSSNVTPPVPGQTPQDKLNQDYGVTPQPNAQAEVQTTNDDINNY